MKIFIANNKKRINGFTLIETLIYLGLLVFAAGVITNFVYVSLKSNQKIQVENELNNQSVRLEEIFRQKISQAQGINSLSANELNLKAADPSLDPTVFSWVDDALYLTEGGSSIILNDKNKIKVTNFSAQNVAPIGEAGGISGNYHYAFNDQVGWLDFAYSGGNIFVPINDGELSGTVKILSDDSWLYLNCLNLDVCSTSNFKVQKDINGDLSGFAWSENYGWISFNCLTDGSCGSSQYKVYVDSERIFHGFAWSENLGWISFNCENGGANGENICSTSDYKVQLILPTSPILRISFTLQYNSSKPELAVEKTKTFIVQILKSEE